jgi:hypothetical protein
MLAVQPIYDVPIIDRVPSTILHSEDPASLAYRCCKSRCCMEQVVYVALVNFVRLRGLFRTTPAANLGTVLPLRIEHLGQVTVLLEQTALSNPRFPKMSCLISHYHSRPLQRRRKTRSLVQRCWGWWCGTKPAYQSQLSDG